MTLILTMVGLITLAACIAIAGVVFLFGVADEFISEEDDNEQELRTNGQF